MEGKIKKKNGIRPTLSATQARSAHLLSPELLGRSRLLMSTVSNTRGTALFTRPSTLYQIKVRGN